MHELTIVYPFLEDDTERLVEAFDEGSLLKSHVEDYHVHRILGGKGVLLLRQRWFPQGKALTVEGDKWSVLLGYLVNAKLSSDQLSISSSVSRMVDGLSDSSILDFFDESLGEFAFFSGDDSKVNIYQSLSETFPLYYGVNDSGVNVISTRASVCSVLCSSGEVDFNVDALLDVTLFDSILDDSTYDKRVNVFPPYKTVVLSHDGISFKEQKNRWVSEQSERLASDTEFAYGEIVKVVDELVEDLNVLPQQFEIGRDLVFNLSGGKDSRALLALFSRSEMLSHHKEILTLGEGNDPEVVSATKVADTLSVPHLVKPRSVPTNRFFDLLVKHVFQMEGDINARVLHGNFEGTRSPVFTGHEVGIRDSFPGQSEVSSWSEVDEFISNKLPFDPIGIISSEKLNKRIDVLKGRVDLAKKISIRPENFMNFLQAVGRGRRWVGKLTSASSSAGPYINLLCSAKVIKLIHNLGPTHRRLELFHFAVINHLQPDWIAIPFSGQKWSDELFDRLSVGISPSIPITGDAKAVSAWWDVMYADKDRFIDLLTKFFHPSLVKHVDYDRLVDYVGKVDRPSARAMLSIFSIFSNSILLAFDRPIKSRVEELEKVVTSVSGSTYGNDGARLEINSVEQLSRFSSDYGIAGASKSKLEAISLVNVAQKLSFLEFFDFLRVAKSALSLGGHLVVECPDVDKVIESYVRRHDTEAVFSINRALYGWGHKAVFGRRVLARMFSVLGFSAINSDGDTHNNLYVRIEGINVYPLNEGEVNLFRQKLIDEVDGFLTR